ncbi:MAG: nickel-dependent hydrogenase large subunit [Candidatus Latescibacterota bacterium]
MAEAETVRVPFNRVEGDLEIRTRLENGVVAEAWASGTLFRGFEQILAGRGALDGLVMTPRICGICGTSHQTAAVRALEQIAGVAPPPDAQRVRNVALTAEHIQSDVRHAFLLFTPDFVRPDHASLPLYEEACRRYPPLQGQTVLETLRQTKKVLEIVAILGGQWPHSSFMVPGGVVGSPSDADLQQCRLLLRQYRRWYEERVLGCALERWLAVDSVGALHCWLEESAAHRDGELGFFLRFARQAGLDAIGRGPGAFLSVGGLDLPQDTGLRGPGGGQLVPAGFAQGTRVSAFAPACITEHVAYSWYRDYEGGRHPSLGETEPYATGEESRKYSWAKAPRYLGLPAETGPLAEMVVAGKPLFVDWLDRHGPSALVRQLARLARPAELMPAMAAWLEELREGGEYYRAPGEVRDGAGFGLIQAARGALGHWVEVKEGRIAHYQVITPTAWNASPRDTDGVRGPLEEALIGTPAGGAEAASLAHVVRSFDPCLVCTVH